MNKKQLVCVLIPAISQHEVSFLGAKNKVKSKTNSNKKETIRTLLNGTVEKYETPIAAAKRIMYDKFDMILDMSVPAKVIKTHSTDIKDVYFVYIDKLLDFEALPIANIAADLQELILVNEYTDLSFETEKKTLAAFLDTDEIDSKFFAWEVASENNKIVA